ncbi:MAG: uracil-DNA glycosylase [Desulfobacterales bacterium]|jgi:uracil-DNA glycosylase|nr:uracil-DNA glycosylase [Desulfobacteraceae bacterium]MBT4363894.1 uracil-DNA glycosylase [Desulfobacteraceae bacterium]MBT7086730.1 uracil-DNA glycosylase [Desulfobacterales bacterium]
MKQAHDKLKLEPSWKRAIGSEFEKEYIKQLREFLVREKSAGRIIYPKGNEYFNAFNLTPLDDVKVVIIGQDPYHGPEQAHGLCFSVKPGVSQPPSLKNIFKEINSDLGIKPPDHGCLIPWAKQGVLLLNSVLTVEKGKAASHQGRGWERLTDHVISVLNEYHENLVFLLWGSYAQKKGEFINSSKHCVLKSPHPSPFSVHRGFFGNRHFSKTNEYLEKNEKGQIEWQLND